MLVELLTVVMQNPCKPSAEYKLLEERLVYFHSCPMWFEDTCYLPVSYASSTYQSYLPVLLYMSCLKIKLLLVSETVHSVVQGLYRVEQAEVQMFNAHLMPPAEEINDTRVFKGVKMSRSETCSVSALTKLQRTRLALVASLHPVSYVQCSAAASLNLQATQQLTPPMIFG
ncbi:hypothetical protein DKX38_024666 [Salix brachista]|uniref:Uncharacterized protein n=1 Tax=Salix brachista TaxID=2182728 RepID=A0A5N5JZQ5_9ROSI|nr:hypothetical protein DKX38_024666 [Salix brachista]